MLSPEEIHSAVSQVAMRFPIKRVSCFGSYADGRRTEKSDLDLLIEFQRPAVSLFMLSAIKGELEDLLKIPVDIIHAPIAANALITIEKTIPVYG